jgi:hypothetical protein
MSDITPALEGLRDGTVDVLDAMSLFAGRQWPVRRAHQPAVTPGEDLAADVADGSFGEVEAALAAGWISAQDYARLAAAAASSVSGAPDAGRPAGRDGDNDILEMGGDDWRTAPDIPARQDELFPAGDDTKSLAGDPESLVYQRGVQAWPGEKTLLSPHDWASGRVEAFRRLRDEGTRQPGYTRDDDLLS